MHRMLSVCHTTSIAAVGCHSSTAIAKPKHTKKKETKEQKSKTKYRNARQGRLRNHLPGNTFSLTNKHCVTRKQPVWMVMYFTYTRDNTHVTHVLHVSPVHTTS